MDCIWMSKFRHGWSKRALRVSVTDQSPDPEKVFDLRFNIFLSMKIRHHDIR